MIDSLKLVEQIDEPPQPTQLQMPIYVEQKRYQKTDYYYLLNTFWLLRLQNRHPDSNIMYQYSPLAMKEFDQDCPSILNFKQVHIKPYHMATLKNLLESSQKHQKNQGNVTQFQGQTASEIEFIKTVLPVIEVYWLSSHFFDTNLMTDTDEVRVYSSQNSPNLLALVLLANDDTGCIHYGFLSTQSELLTRGNQLSTIVNKIQQVEHPDILNPADFFSLIIQEFNRQLRELQDDASDQLTQRRSLLSYSPLNIEDSSNQVANSQQSRSNQVTNCQQSRSSEIQEGCREFGTPTTLPPMKPQLLALFQLQAMVKSPKELIEKISKIPPQYSQHCLQNICRSIYRNRKLLRICVDWVEDHQLNQPSETKVYRNDVLKNTSRIISEIGFPSRIQEEMDKPIEVGMSSILQNNNQNGQDQFFQHKNVHLETRGRMLSYPEQIEKHEDSGSPQIVEISSKIKVHLKRRGIKSREVKIIAKAYHEARNAGMITKDNISQWLRILLRNKNPRYYLVLQELFGGWFQQGTSGQSEDGFVRSFQQFVSTLILHMPKDIKVYTRINSGKSVQQLCKLVNALPEGDICELVQIKLSRSIIIRTLIKGSVTSKAIRLVFEDYKHQYDCTMLLQRVQLTPAAVCSYLSKQTTCLKQGSLFQNPLLAKDLARKIHQAMIGNRQGWLTAFMRVQSQDGGMLYMFKMYRESESQFEVIFKLGIRLLSPGITHDQVVPYIYKKGNKLTQ